MQEMFQFVQKVSHSVLCLYLTVISEKTLYCYVCSTELLLLLVFSPLAGLCRDQSSVRRLVWLNTHIYMTVAPSTCNST